MNYKLIICILALVYITCAYHNTTRYGILYVNEIIANSDTRTVQIDGSFIEDNIIRLDVLEEWTGNGINVEGVYLKDTNAFLYADFVVNPDCYLPQDWNLFFNGGLVADSPYEDLFSFHIEDDTGRTSIRGTLFPGKGINCDIDAFTVEDNSGETIIRDALLNANGGINVEQSNFIVNALDGSIETRNYIHIEGTINIGNTDTNDRRISRIDTTDKFGGISFFSAQNGTRDGGNLYFIPGVGSQESGNIFFGREQGDNIILHRDIEYSTDKGGDTYLVGQSSSLGNGGAIIIAGGKSVGNGNGGNIILAPGTTDDDDDTSTNHGRILFGTDVDNKSRFDLTIQRPFLQQGDGGDTFLVGQNSQNGDAGDLTLRGGHVRDNGNGIGGPIYIDPGLDNNYNQADIIIGNQQASNLALTRFIIPSLGGDTYWLGQSSTLSNGGDLHIIAGKSDGPGSGGCIHLVPGTTPINPAGHIFFGSPLDLVQIGRHPANGGGAATLFIGQESTASTGGDYKILSGNGMTDGGNIILSGGNGAGNSGGNVNVIAGDGEVSGGFISILGGEAITGNAGDILINAGTGTGFRGGNIYLNAGSGTLLGSVIIQQPCQVVTINEMPIVIRNSHFEIQSLSSSLVLRPDSNKLVEHDGVQILRELSDIPILYSKQVIDNESALSVIKNIQHGFNTLINALGQCQHGLLQTLDPNGAPRECPSASTDTP